MGKLKSLKRMEHLYSSNKNPKDKPPTLLKKSSRISLPPPYSLATQLFNILYKNWYKYKTLNLDFRDLAIDCSLYLLNHLSKKITIKGHPISYLLKSTRLYALKMIQKETKEQRYKIVLTETMTASTNTLYISDIELFINGCEEIDKVGAKALKYIVSGKATTLRQLSQVLHIPKSSLHRKLLKIRNFIKSCQI